MRDKSNDTLDELAYDFISRFEHVAAMANFNAHDKGFYETPSTIGEQIALIHSELSEALEGYRHGNPPSGKIPEFSAMEEEFADVIIRIMDTGYEQKYRIAEAIIAKMKFNRGRAYKHGGKRI